MTEPEIEIYRVEWDESKLYLFELNVIFFIPVSKTKCLK